MSLHKSIKHHRHFEKHDEDHDGLKIILEENDIFLPGQFVRGTIVTHLEQDVPLSECHIKLMGVAEIAWTDNPGIRDEGRSFHIKRNLLEMVYTPENLNPDTDYYCVGNNEIYFEFFWPENLNLMSSYQSRFGSIKYFVDVKIGEKTRKQDILVEIPIVKNLFLTVGGTSEKDFGVLSFASGQITMQAVLNKKGFFRGEEIQLNYVIDNSSTTSVKPRATFYQTQIYMTGEKHKTVENSLTEAIEGDEIPAHTIVEDASISVPIPVNIPLSMKSDLITLKYTVHVTLDIPMAVDIHINLPVIITTRGALENSPIYN